MPGILGSQPGIDPSREIQLLYDIGRCGNHPTTNLHKSEGYDRETARSILTRRAEQLGLTIFLVQKEIRHG